jgi:hypothetical protein
MINDFANPATHEAIGMVTVGKTTYEVHRMDISPRTAEFGAVCRLALVGPKGAYFMVTDYGLGWNLNVVRVSRNAAARGLPGLTREHLTAFGVEA